MVLEGKKYCIRISRGRLQELNGALQRAGYSRHTGFKFEKQNEIGSWTCDMDDGNWIHVQVVDAGRYLEIFAHYEPSLNLDPFGHVISAFSESGINFGVGSHTLRSHLKQVGFNFR